MVLPRAAYAAVARQARIKEGIPSYESQLEPDKLINRVRSCLSKLEHKARCAGVKVLLELHWGTMMSSFSSAYILVNDLDPQCIGITFDPANMMVEGKEDWEFGLRLIRQYIANVHIKNVSWTLSKEGWIWQWAKLQQGMLDWSHLISVLSDSGYQGEFAIEDFLAPQSDMLKTAEHIRTIRNAIEEMLFTTNYLESHSSSYAPSIQTIN